MQGIISFFVGVVFGVMLGLIVAEFINTYRRGGGV